MNENTDLGEDDVTKASPEKIAAAVKVTQEAPLPAGLRSPACTRFPSSCKLAKFETLKKALNDIGVTGMTVTQVMGCGLQKGSGEKYRGAEVDATLLPKVKVEVVVSKIPVDKIIDTATKTLYTGHIGDEQDLRLQRGKGRQGPHRRAGLRRIARRGVIRSTI